jgi:hypothetical protein
MQLILKSVLELHVKGWRSCSALADAGKRSCKQRLARTALPIRLAKECHVSHAGLMPNGHSHFASALDFACIVNTVSDVPDSKQQEQRQVRATCWSATC